ncbi:nitrogen fixation protein FixH [Azorhizobium oxalatiphilum]|uniref:Nitrogen fixation protein FixH n=1 Tax=Azorhizobium oxalatiphilum TaxID=980631 RepID=A0A917CAW8_9HYPH|nr:FixH family protein [Azorhizobium oxalatiphilum]GGF81056.1 nitrogen fixation protein FixH [Azorhizobium oxalatiphilum]
MTMVQSRPAPKGGRPGRVPGQLTGWHVLAALLGFFGLIIAVNVVMAHYAVATFGGVETESSYKAGLAFKAEEDAAATQNARQWRVILDVSDRPDGTRLLVIEARDAAGKPLAGYAVDARFAHPADARQDVTVPLTDLGGGRYQGTAGVHRGQWELIVDLAQGEGRLFRSKNRVQLR